jgi:hypothetical protein
MGDVGPGLRLDLQLVLGEDRVAALGDRVDPAVDIEDDGGGRAIFGDADGDQAGIRQEEIAETGAVLVGRASDGGVDGLGSLWEDRLALQLQIGRGAQGRARRR